MKTEDEEREGSLSVPPQPGTPQSTTKRVVPPEQLPLPGMTVSYSQEYMGPVPSPAMLAEYEQVIPGLGSTLVQSFLDEGSHRRGIERDLANAHISGTRLGMFLAFATVVIFAGVALVAVLRGYPWVGATILGVDLVGLVGVFIYGRHAESKDNAMRLRQLPQSNGSQGQGPDSSS